jgi:hypothetical protein
MSKLFFAASAKNFRRKQVNRKGILIMKNRNIVIMLASTLSVLACFMLSPMVQAVVPAPDGGYPGGNTAEGTNALHNRTSGQNNTAVGLNALYADTTGGRNTGLGVQTLRFNITGASNTAVGINALYRNTKSYNTAVGDSALFSNTTGNENTAEGYRALYNNTTDFYNTAIGSLALYSNSASSNTAIGSHALISNTTGAGNTAIGADALDSNIGGGNNTATGVQALDANTSGYFNTANGYQALQRNTIGFRNTANGVAALYNNTSGSNNTALGNGAGSNVTTASNVICIGAGIAGANTSNSCFIGNIFGVNNGFGAAAVYIAPNGALGTTPSSKRFKEHIKPMDKASDALLALKPVTFRYKSDAKGTPQFGLIAEEVAEVNPDLVVRDKDGEIYSVRYDQVNAMLLNEFLKEHKKVAEQSHKIKEQETTITELKKEMETVVARLKEHESQIQNVSDQIELRKIVANDRQ